MNNYQRTNEVLLDIQNVSLKFGDKLVLRDVNATVTDVERDGHAATGQVICFLGPSGIGKTQLSRVIAGLQIPTKGRVTLKDELLTAPGKVGMVPQHYPLFEYATIAENLMIAGKQGGLNKQEINEKASVYIEAFGLRDYLGMYPRSLSGGTKQRVAIARQLMCANNYMVMDEPFSGLDPIMKRQASDAIVKLAQMDTHNTIIIVTHDITEGLMVADMVWLMGLEKHSVHDKSVADVFIPGAKLVKTYDLAEMGFAWRPDLNHDQAFLKFVAEIKDQFQTLR